MARSSFVCGMCGPAVVIEALPPVPPDSDFAVAMEWLREQIRRRPELWDVRVADPLKFIGEERPT